MIILHSIWSKQAQLRKKESVKENDENPAFHSTSGLEPQPLRSRLAFG